MGLRRWRLNLSVYDLGVRQAGHDDFPLSFAIASARPSMLCFVVPDWLSRTPVRVLGGRPWPTINTIIGIASVCPVAALLLIVPAELAAPELWNTTSWFVLYYFVLNTALIALPQDAWRRLEELV